MTLSKLSCLAVACGNGLIKNAKNGVAFARTGRAANTVVIIRINKQQTTINMKIVEVSAKPQKL